MATVFEDGFESGGTSNWNTSVGTPTVQTTTVRTDQYALACDAGDHLTRTIAAGNRVAVCRLWFRTSAIPTTARAHIGGFTTSSNVLLQIKVDGTVAIFNGGTQVDVGPSISAGVWYRFDYRLNTSANPWVVTWAIDGADQGSPTIASTAADIDGFRVGHSGTGNSITLVDDCWLSLTSADYPLTDRTSTGLYVVRQAVNRASLF